MKRIFFKQRLLVLLILWSGIIFAQAGSYYDGISVSSPTFVDDLKTRVDSPYTKISYDNFDETNIANFAASDNGNGTSSVTCVYSGYVYTYTPPFTWVLFSREHTYCHSWMPTNPAESRNEYADQHHLFPTHQNNANNRRSNHPLGEVVNISYQYLDGILGTNSLGETVYEPRDSHKGDAARAILYMMLRYDDIDGYNWDFNSLNLRITSSPYNEAPQSLDLLLGWHDSDPPDAWEISRNDYVQSIQKNRNPFVDHPEYTDYIDFNDMSYISGSSAATEINFTSVTATVLENSGSYNLTLSITNPSATAAATADIVLTSGSASDIGNYTTQSISFPAGSSADINVPVTINNGIISGSDKEFVFGIQNVSGGENAAAGAVSGFTLRVTESGQSLYISEYSDASGTGNYIYEFVEIYNPLAVTFNAGGYKLRQANSSITYTIPSDTYIPATGFLVIARNSTQEAFETFWNKTLEGNAVYVNSGGSIPQLNGDEQYLIEDALGINVDPSTDDEFSAKPVTANNRVYRLSSGNSLSDWALTSWSTATPGSFDENQVLPVELTSFGYEVRGDAVCLQWKTATEVNNYGFEIERMLVASNYKGNLIGSQEEQNWETIAFLPGYGNSNSPKNYEYTDFSPDAGRIFYRLKQIDNDGVSEYSKVLELTFSKSIEIKGFSLSQNFPNPFNPSTTINYEIGENSGTGLKQNVRLTVFDILGKEIAILVNSAQEAGHHSVSFNAANLESGVYFYELKSGDFTSRKKMVFLK